MGAQAPPFSSATTCSSAGPLPKSWEAENRERRRRAGRDILLHCLGGFLRSRKKVGTDSELCVGLKKATARNESFLPCL